MVVVVDRVNRLYAYTKKEVDLEGASPTFPVLFRPWIQQWIDERSQRADRRQPGARPRQGFEYANTSTPPMNTPRHTLYLLRLVVALLFVSAFLSRCASMMTPTGGPRDSLPPSS